MFSRLMFATSSLAAALAFTVHAQVAPSRKPEVAKTIPRTPDGHPDLQGVWMNNMGTPFERPKELEGRALLTDQEVTELNRRAKRIFSSGDSDAASADEYFLSAWRNIQQYKSGGATDSSERVLPLIIDNRTSLITDPPNGKLPAYTEAGQKRRAAYGRARSGRGNPSGPKEVAPGDRCITFGVPRVNGVYSAGLYGYYQIVQTKDQVLFFSEAIHDTRIIPTDGRPHVPGDIRMWSGDSRGHWEGNTLVVDTANFNNKGWIATSAATGRVKGIMQTEATHVVERFRRTDAGTLSYEVTIEDPNMYTRPWKVAIPFWRDDSYRMYEYACHEGNEAPELVLRGGRARDESK